jgi:hypothetical protein
MLKITVNKNATAMLDALAKKVDTYPNRIKQAQYTAAVATARTMPRRVGGITKGAKYIEYDVASYGPTGLVLTARPPKKIDSGGKHKRSKFYAAATTLGGRRKFVLTRAHLKGKQYFVLRPESRAQYGKRKKPPLTIPKMFSKEDMIKDELRDTMINELQKAFRRQGFGPRGGRSGPDLPSSGVGR